MTEIRTRKHDLSFELSTLKDQLATVEERMVVVEKDLEEKREKEKVALAQAVAYVVLLFSYLFKTTLNSFFFSFFLLFMPCVLPVFRYYGYCVVVVVMGDLRSGIWVIS